MEKSRPILVYGPPRSGTTWLAHVLCSGSSLRYIHEPDNIKNNYLAYLQQLKLTRFPYIRETEMNNDYLKLFDRAFYGKFIESGTRLNTLLLKLDNLHKDKIEQYLGSQDPETRKSCGAMGKLLSSTLYTVNPGHKRRLIKSVHCLLSMPFLQKHIDFIPFLIVRHPAAVISSHMKLNMPDADRKIYFDPKIKRDFLYPFQDQINLLRTELEFAALHIGIYHFILSQYIRNHNFDFVKHEDLCLNTTDQFQAICKKLNIKWEKQMEDYIIEHNQIGQDGYDIYRDCNELAANWKKKLSLHEIEQIYRGYTLLPNSFNYTFE